MYYCYILFSLKLNKYYTGYTADIATRLAQHNSKQSNFTANASDWKVVYTEFFMSRNEALAREKQIKSKKSRKYIEYLISTM